MLIDYEAPNIRMFLIYLFRGKKHPVEDYGKMRWDARVYHVLSMDSCIVKYLTVVMEHDCIHL